MDLRKARKAVEGLSRELLTIEAKGDYEGGKRLMERLVVLRPEVQAVLGDWTACPWTSGRDSSRPTNWRSEFP